MQGAAICPGHRRRTITPRSIESRNARAPILPGSDGSTAEMCTKTSFDPSLGAMKPKPFEVLKNFTVPVVIYVSSYSVVSKVSARSTVLLRPCWRMNSGRCSSRRGAAMGGLPFSDMPPSHAD